MAVVAVRTPSGNDLAVRLQGQGISVTGTTEEMSGEFAIAIEAGIRAAIRISTL
jgi:hypothetical protein